MSRRPPRPAGVSIIPPQAEVPAFIPTSMVAPRAAMAPNDATRQMASDMREAAYREGGLTRDGLELLGYTNEQIEALAAKARRMAQLQAGVS